MYSNPWKAVIKMYGIDFILGENLTSWAAGICGQMSAGHREHPRQGEERTVFKCLTALYIRVSFLYFDSNLDWLDHRLEYYVFRLFSSKDKDVLGCFVLVNLNHFNPVVTLNQDFQCLRGSGQIVCHLFLSK